MKYFEGNFLPLSWKLFRDNQENSLLKSEKNAKHSIPRYLDIQNWSPAASGSLPGTHTYKGREKTMADSQNMDHWTDLPSENHWKPVSFTSAAIYTSCWLFFWARCTHQIFISVNTSLSYDFDSFLTLFLTNLSYFCEMSKQKTRFPMQWLWSFYEAYGLVQKQEREWKGI